MIQPERIQQLNDRAIARGDFVLYWMQQSQRAEYNHALEYAALQANELNLPLLVVFGLMHNYPEANLRHYAFMLQGLKETQSALEARGIKLSVQFGNPPDVALHAGAGAAMIVCDRGYLRHQKAWRNKVAEVARCRVVQVESDVVVPVETVSNKAEYAARTIRPRIHRHLDRFLVELRATVPNRASLGLGVQSLDLTDPMKALGELELDRSVSPVTEFFEGGTQIARQRFRRFAAELLTHYKSTRNQPGSDNVSHMSPYLHFGQISPLYLALEIRKARVPDENKQAFLEELIVRRELTMNFVQFTRDYDSFDCLPGWAKSTLNAHRSDEREYVYTRAQLERAETHDPYWNAAMHELKLTGYMHNYMRMYWGKKILEWSNTPESAFETTLAIMNKYFLDGRDCNSYASVAWLLGAHDRPWFDRPIFGTVRYMAASGLKRKAQPEAYLEKVRKLALQIK